MFRLHVQRPGMQPEVHTIHHDVATIGRARECDVPIDDPEVSRRHTRVLRGLIVLDLGSRNGTWIEQTRVSEATRVPANRFLIGQGERAITIDVETEGEAAPPADDGYEATITVERRPSATSAPAAAPKPPDAATPPPPAAAASAAAGASAQEIAQLRVDLERQRQRAYEAGRELEALKGGRDASQVAASSELAAARLEVMQLRQRLGSLKSELEVSAQAGQQGLETKLLQEKLEASEQRAATLERRVRELESAPASAPAANVPMSEFVARMQRELMRVQSENGELKAQLARGAVAPAAAAAPVAPVALPPAPPPPVRRAAPAVASGARVDLQPLCGTEFERFEPPVDADLHDFVLVAALRFLRAVERVVAYSAREFIGLLEMRTIVPDHDRNLAAWLGELLAAPRDAALRQGLDRYLRELSRWLVAGMTAYKSAARDFVLDVKKSLGEEALCAGSPLSGFKKMTGQADAELWKRATQRLAELSPDTIDDRIERLAREIAQKVLAGAPPPAAS